MTLSELINKLLEERTQTRLAELCVTTQSNITRWKKAKKGPEPTFENCLRLAVVANEDPTKVFEMLKGPKAAKYRDLYIGMFPAFVKRAKCTVDNLEGYDRDTVSALERVVTLMSDPVKRVILQGVIEGFDRSGAVKEVKRATRQLG